MSAPSANKLNQLDRLVPEGLVVDAPWLSSHGYYNSLRARYVASGWLDHLSRNVYRRPRGALDWQQVVVSLQTLLDYPVVVGGRTALELQGFGHYASGPRVIHLYGQRPPPGWLDELPLSVELRYHNGARLFSAPIQRRCENLEWAQVAEHGALCEPQLDSLVNQAVGHQPWPLALSTPERAILEAVDELPRHDSFHQLDMLMEGLSHLRPRRLQTLLEACKSVKVKRLFFFLADRHDHAWLKRLDRNAISLGRGKRVVAQGGKLDPTYQITVPEDL